MKYVPQSIARAVRLEPAPSSEAQPRFVPLNAEFALRDPPVLRVATPLPCDLAHTAAIEFEGVPGLFAAGSVVLSGQGTGGPAGTASFPIDSVSSLPPGTIDHPGECRLRVHLTASPHLGWADPDVRSVWPGDILTDWCPARISRR